MADKSLVIVESPAKAKTINKYLGSGFVVKSSVGHIRDLPVSGGSKNDPKARAKEAAKTRKMPPEKKEAYKKEKAKSITEPPASPCPSRPAKQTTNIYVLRP